MTVRCPACGHDNAADFRFCGSCGRPLGEAPCELCGFRNPRAQPFCGGCGARLETTTPAPAPRGERRLATVLFADVVGFTSLAEDRDPEAVATTVDAALRGVAQTVMDHGGTVDKFIGDSVMALFGIPTAHGDDAERAVAAALAIRQQAGELRFAIGVNSGEVMATPVGEGGELTAIGDAVNVAARLEETAAAGDILVGPLTAELVRSRFVLRSCEPALLRGKREPVDVYEVIAQRGDAEGETASAPPLVDREADLNFLLSCWRRAGSLSRTQLVLVTGEAGIGKTRIAGELAAVAREEGLVARAACPGYGSLVGARVAMDLSRALSPDGALAASLDEQGVLRLRQLLAERAAQGSVLAVVDDVHHAQRPDLEAIAQLAARAAELPLTLVLVGRPQPAEWLAVFAGATTLRLDPLSPDDAVRLAGEIAGGRLPGPDPTIEIAAESGGNPLHIRELVRLIAADQDRYSLDGRLPLPASLNAVLSARLDSLSQQDKAVLQAVAIFSDGAAADEIAAVAGHGTRPALDRLVTSGFLREAEGDRFSLLDPLLREVAYEQLPRAARGRHHRTAAGVARTPLGRARHLGLAATYLPDDTELHRQAAATVAATGIELIDGSDFRGGIELLRQAVKLGHDEPRALIRLAQAETDLGNAAASKALLDRVDTTEDAWLEAAVLHARANDLQPEPGEAIRLLGEAADRWRALGDQRKLAWALANRSNALFRLGRVDEAAPDVEESLAIFGAVGDRDGAAAAGQQLAMIRPDDPRVPDLLAAGLELAEERSDLVKMRNALIPLAWSRFVRGHLGGDSATAGALADAERLAQVAGDIGDASFAVQGHCLAAVLLRLCGRIAEAEERIRRARSARLPDDSLSEPLLAAAAFMVALAGRGEPEARPEPATSANPLEIVSDALVIEALLLGGHLEAAREHLGRSTLDLGPREPPLLLRLVRIVRGAVLVLSGTAAQGGRDVEETLAAAREAARAVGAVPTEVASAALLAEWLARGARHPDARAALASIDADPGGVAGLLADRACLLLGERRAGDRVRQAAARLAAPGLGLEVEAAAL